MMIRFYDHGFGVFDKARPLPGCCWDRFDLLCIHRGRLWLQVEDEAPFALTPGQGVLVYPHTRFDGHVTQNKAHVSVQHFAITQNKPPLPGVLARLIGKEHGCERVTFTSPASFKADVMRAMQLAFLPQSPAVHDQRVAMLVLILSQLQSNTLTASGSMHTAWQALTPWLRGQLHQQVSVTQMASHVNMSTAHFIQRFKALHRQTPGRYFQRLRMSEAQRLLRETDLPIKEIARQLGSDDLPNFYRTFRSIVAVSPASYRKRHTLRG